MSFVTNMETKRKLHLKSVIWIVLLVAIMLGVYRKTESIEGKILSTYPENIVAGQDVLEIKADMNGARAILVTMFAETDKAKLDDLNNTLKAVTKRVDERYEAILQNKYFANNRGMAEEVNRIREVWTAFRDTRDSELIPAIYAGNLEKARQLALGIQAERYHKFIDLSDEFIKKETKEGHDKLQETAYFVANMRSGVILMCIFLIVFDLLMNMIFSKMVIEPISKGITLAEAIASGNVDEKIESAYLERRDEIGMLMKSMDKMSAGLNRFSTSVSGSSGKVIESSKQLSALSDEIARGTDRQAQKASLVATASEEMISTVAEVAKSATVVSQAADDAGRAAKKGGEIVSRTVDSMNGIVGSVKRSASTISQLGARSEEIGQIAGVIDDIADQTNLLALNAAIEAARAGEQGRGFAVVADEVRKLAERTSKATKEIDKMIVAIQEETRNAVSVMEEGTREVETGVKLAEEAGTALDEIISSVEKVAGMIQQITVASGEQSKVADEISKDIEEVAEVTKDTAKSVNMIASAVHDLNILASELKSVVSSFKVTIALNWSDSLLTGNSTIDTQHKELFTRINMLLEAASQSRGGETVREVIEFLQDYVVMHFGTEQKIMEGLNYPGYADHKERHDQLVKDFLALKSKLEKNNYRFDGTTMDLAEFEEFLGSWLNNHIKKIDKALAGYVKKHGRRGSAV